MNRKDRKSRRASRRMNRKDRKSRRASRRNNMMGGRRASRKDRKDRKSRRSSRRNNAMMGGRNSRRSPKIVRRVYAPVGTLGVGAGETISTAARAGVNVFGTAVKGLDKTFKTAAGTINATVGKIFSARRRRGSRRH
jgi:hypothetical protein